MKATLIRIPEIRTSLFEKSMKAVIKKEGFLIRLQTKSLLRIIKKKKTLLFKNTEYFIYVLLFEIILELTK
jgi:hypothetical protein